MSSGAGLLHEEASTSSFSRLLFPISVLLRGAFHASTYSRYAANPLSGASPVARGVDRVLDRHFLVRLRART